MLFLTTFYTSYIEDICFKINKIFLNNNVFTILIIAVVCLVIIFDFVKTHYTTRGMAVNKIPGGPIYPFINNSNLFFGPPNSKFQNNNFINIFFYIYNLLY